MCNLLSSVCNVRVGITSSPFFYRLFFTVLFPKLSDQIEHAFRSFDLFVTYVGIVLNTKIEKPPRS